MSNHFKFAFAVPKDEREQAEKFLAELLAHVAEPDLPNYTIKCLSKMFELFKQDFTVREIIYLPLFSTLYPEDNELSLRYGELCQAALKVNGAYKQ
jgi:hypothetical protein